MIRLGEKNKNEKASVLAVTLIILGIGILIAISAVLVSVRERRASIGEGSSSRAFQMAESGIEETQESIKKVALENPGTAKVSDLDGGSSTLTCDTVSKNFKTSTQVEIELQNNVDVKIDCDDALASLDVIFYIKAYGESRDNQRLVKSTLSCAGANISSNLIGHWPFGPDKKYKDVHDKVNTSVGSENPAEPCTNSSGGWTDYSATGLAETVDEEPDFDTDPGPGGRKFIKFNDNGEKNCAVIENLNGYKTSKGTISFWVRYRDISEARWIFSKDARGCDTDASVDRLDTYWDCGSFCDFPVAGNSRCDCGHASFYENSGNLFFKFQNDGDSAKGVGVDSTKFPFDVLTWENKWHLVTLVFDEEKYILYIDSQKNSEISKADDIVDGALEGLLGNDWRIWLGAVYPNISAGWSQADMDDLRIYDRALTQCDVIKLFREQGK